MYFQEQHIQCPFCFEFQEFEFEFGDQGKMIVDCQICCRPIEINIESNIEDLNIDTDYNDFNEIE